MAQRTVWRVREVEFWGPLQASESSYLLDLSLGLGLEVDAEKVEGGQESIQSLRKSLRPYSH